MVEPVELIGFFAGACMLGAILLRNIYAIKILLLVATLSFMTYGIIQWLPSIMIVNGILALFGIYELVRLRIKKRQTAA